MMNRRALFFPLVMACALAGCDDSAVEPVEEVTVTWLGSEAYHGEDARGHLMLTAEGVRRRDLWVTDPEDRRFFNELDGTALSLPDDEGQAPHYVYPSGTSIITSPIATSVQTRSIVAGGSGFHTHEVRIRIGSSFYFKTRNSRPYDRSVYITNELITCESIEDEIEVDASSHHEMTYGLLVTRTISMLSSAYGNCVFTPV